MHVMFLRHHTERTNLQKRGGIYQKRVFCPRQDQISHTYVKTTGQITRSRKRASLN